MLPTKFFIIVNYYTHGCKISYHGFAYEQFKAANR
jgi:hypothetical protein